MLVLGLAGQCMPWLQHQEWVGSGLEAESGALGLQGLVERRHLRVEGGAHLERKADTINGGWRDLMTGITGGSC